MTGLRGEHLADCPLDDACPPECRSVFDRVVVSHAIAGPARVMWELLDTFTDPGPLTFQLQVGATTNPLADDWENVGVPVVDQYVAFDDEQRVWGKTNWTHYRVRVSSASGVAYSLPTGGMGILNRHDWRMAREIIRQRKLAYRVGPGGQRGYLLKRRWTGLDCQTCLDPVTREVRNPDCPDCYGTGKQCGYYYPMGCTWAEMDPKTYRTALDPQRGTTNDIVLKAEMVVTEILDEEDVFIVDKTDERYFVHRVQHTSEIRGVPLVAKVELRPIPYSSAIYSITIPDQLRRLEA